jgi:hypothetical protein
MAMATTVGALSEAEHSAQLRKAVIASTVGTAIEWYDFFLYGTAAGLVFGKLFFPNQDPLSATLLAFGTYFIGFAARPVGAAIFGHYGDRIGRKATLIATLLAWACDLRHRLRADLCSIGIWGACPPDRPAGAARHRRRRRMGRLGAAGDGMVAHPRPARPGGLVAAIRRALRASAVDAGGLAFSAWSGDQFLVWGWRSVRALDHPGRHRPVDSPRHPRDAGVPEAPGRPTRSRRRRSSKSSRSSRRRSFSRRCCGCRSRRRSTSSPPSCSPTRSAR